jgi:3-oxoacyl-[acyl-carrier protein] reductase
VISDVDILSVYRSITEKRPIMNMSGKIAVVTGGSRGIGAAIARKLAAEGAIVAVVYNNKREAADAVVQSIREGGGSAAAFQADVSNETEVQAMMHDVAGKFKHIDMLVNSAGTFGGAPVGDISRQSFHDQFFTNTWSVIATTQAALPYFPSSGGAIVNVSSSLAVRPEAGTVVYSASKAAIDSLTLGCAIELGARGIRVNAVAPAITRTDMTADIPAAKLLEETRLTPLGRLAEPADIADVVAFLCSDGARWITGRTVLVDGGRI